MRIVSATITVLAATSVLWAANQPVNKPIKPLPYATAELLSPRVRDTYTGNHLNQIHFPLGGIGAGCISLNGRGALVGWSIFGKPNLGWRPELSFFGLWAKAGDDAAVFRVLEGEQPPPYGWGEEGLGHGPFAVAGMPHMGEAVFSARFPFAQVRLKDAGVPCEVTIEGWSPFIPGNDRESSLPAACLSVRVKNVSKKTVTGTLGYNLKNLANEGKDAGTRSALMHRDSYDVLVMDHADKTKAGSLAVASPCRITTWQTTWAPSSLAPTGGFQHFADTFCINGHYDQTATPQEIEAARKHSLRPDIVIDDFESGTFERWTVEGDAFGRGPVDIERDQHPSPVTGYSGKYLADSLLSGRNDGAVGKLISKPFIIERTNLRFLIGGGSHPGETCLNLLVDGKVVRMATGDNSEALKSTQWKVEDLAGRKAQLEIVDTHTGGWGHIMVDDLVMTDAAMEETWPGGVGSVGWQFTLAPGASTTIPLVITWHFPERKDIPGVRNYYATQWADAAAVADYQMINWQRLEQETRQFQQTFFASTLPGVILESISSQLAILRSPTVFRDANGTLHGWEGSWPGSGSCPGTITHVYHYVQSIAYLFPALERGMREFDFSNRLDPQSGGLRQRVWPTKVVDSTVPVDGQFGTILRACREWQISGDIAWLRSWWPGIKKSIEFTWTGWDKNRDGRLDADSSWHCTLDQNLVGDETYGNSMYMAGLLAGEKMANAVGDTAMAAECRRIFEAGHGKTDELCWNGEYYRQIVENPRAENTWQNGVISEQLIGQWWTDMLGLGDIYPRDHMRSAIGAVFRHNFIPDCRKLNNTGFILAQNDDAGLVICSWPKGGRPAKALFYADSIEVGYEDQVAANLVYQGYVLDGIAVMKAIRDRYDGRKRDPYCQIECGGYYARSMANYSLILALAGYRYSAVDQSLELAPKVSADDFRSFFGADSGWGLVTQKRSGKSQRLGLAVNRGFLKLKTFTTELPAGMKPSSVEITLDGRKIVGSLFRKESKVIVSLATPVEVTAGKEFNIILR